MFTPPLKPRHVVTLVLALSLVLPAVAGASPYWLRPPEQGLAWVLQWLPWLDAQWEREGMIIDPFGEPEAQPGHCGCSLGPGVGPAGGAATKEGAVSDPNGTPPEGPMSDPNGAPPEGPMIDPDGTPGT